MARTTGMAPARAPDTELAALRAETAHVRRMNQEFLAMVDTADVLEAFVHCRYKGHLKQTGQMGTRSEYEALTDELQAAVRQRAIEQITARQANGEVLSAVSLTAPTLKQGMTFV